jgi:hypothetical protein
MIGYVSAASGDSWTDSGFLQHGQAVMHQIQVDNSATLKLTSTPSSRFTLYAMQVAIAGVENCPSESNVRDMAFYKSKDTIVLPSGQWCIEVYSSQGSGRYQLEYTPDQALPPILQPTVTMEKIASDSSIPYKVSPQTTIISLKSPNVHSFLVSGERIFVEWIVEPLDCTIPAEIPIIMVSTENINQFQSAVCSLDLNAYLFKDCDPRTHQCPPIAFDESSSPYAYIGIPYPQDKTKYYLLVESVEGSGSYTLTTRSYVQDHVPQIEENNKNIADQKIISRTGISMYSISSLSLVRSGR